MKKLGNRVLLIVCIFCLYMSFSIHVEADSPEQSSFYEDGDVVGFIGDSITHSTYTPVNYVNTLYLYYLSRFPQREVEFRNLGAAGYKVSDILNIYEKDPAFRGINKAVIMLGTNEAILGISPEKYIGNMEKLIGRLKEDGLQGEDILILSPPICDETCSLNYGKSGKPRWAFESRLLAYMDMLESKAAEWGVCYLDIHTPMLKVTEEIQREEKSNTLTTDCIHPSPAGQMLIASSILQSQGAGDEPLSGIFVPEDGEAQVVRGELTDFYRGEKGICFTFQPETFPMAVTEEMLKFQNLLESFDMLCQNLLAEQMFRQQMQVKGLSENVPYKVYMGENNLGTFSGRELAEGINLAALENHPMQMSMQQIDEWSRKRHKDIVKYRNIWVEIAMQRATYTKEPIQAQYEKWRTADEEMRNAMYAEAQAVAGGTFPMSVIEEGYSVEELIQDKKEAEERSQREAEQAKKEAEKHAKREAEELAEKQAEEARKAAEALEAAKEKAEREILWKRVVIGIGACGFLVVLIIILRKRRENVNL